MVHNTYQGLNTSAGRKSLDVELPAGSDCQIWEEGYSDQIRCCKTIFKKPMCFYLKRESDNPFVCYSGSANKTDLSNRLCQKETGKKTCYGDGTYCSYYY